MDDDKHQTTKLKTRGIKCTTCSEKALSTETSRKVCMTSLEKISGDLEHNAFRSLMHAFNEGLAEVMSTMKLIWDLYFHSYFQESRELEKSMEMGKEARLWIFNE